jgi:hypothetical protein
MWILVLMWVAVPSSPQSAGTAVTSLSIPNFESREACGNAYNTLKANVTWGQGIDLVGTCVSSR